MDYCPPYVNLIALRHASELIREASEGGGWITQGLYYDFSSIDMGYEQWLGKIPSLAAKSPSLEIFACLVGLSLVGN